MSQETVVSVRNLETTFTTKLGPFRAVNDISYDIHKGETLGIVGESGCGKSVTSFSLMRLIEPPGFTGRAPGGPSRWSTERSAEWHPLRPELVVEIGYDHISGGRFRHGTRFLRWRPDKAPRQCRMSQLR